MQHLKANLQVPLDEFPPPLQPVCARQPVDPTHFVPQSPLERTKRFIEAVEEGNLKEHIADRAFEDIAWQVRLVLFNCCVEMTKTGANLVWDGL